MTSKKPSRNRYDVFLDEVLSSLAGETGMALRVNMMSALMKKHPMGLKEAKDTVDDYLHRKAPDRL